MRLSAWPWGLGGSVHPHELSHRAQAKTCAQITEKQPKLATRFPLFLKMKEL